jgi:hypothetical protein
MYCAFLEENSRILYSRAEIMPVHDDDMKEIRIVENCDLKTVLGELRSRNVRCRAAVEFWA